MGRQSSILLLLTAITMAVYSEAGQFAFMEEQLTPRAHRWCFDRVDRVPPENSVSHRLL